MLSKLRLLGLLLTELLLLVAGWIDDFAGER